MFQTPSPSGTTRPRRGPDPPPLALGMGHAAWGAGVFLAASLGCCLLLALGVQPLWLPGLGALFAAFLSCLFLSLLLGRLRSRELQNRERDEALDRLESEAVRHRTLLADFASGLDVLILSVDSKMTVLFGNQQAADAFGVTFTPQLSLLSATLSTDLEAIVEKAITSGEAQRAEVTFHHPSHRICLVQVWSAGSGSDQHFIAIYDQTSMKRLERVRRDFVANVSHELRTPLTTIRAMSETLLDLDEDEPELRRRYLGSIIREIDRLAEVAKGLLTLSMVESMSLSKSPCDFTTLVREAIPLHKAKAEAKGLEVRCLLPDSLPLRANAGLLSQVVVNLVENAVNYTSKGWIEIALTEEKGWARLVVKDTGAGIASEHLPRIFERFYRADKGRTRDKGGTGLGLSIVRNIVESHGGKVTVESSLNEGSSFQALIPTDLAPEEPAP